MAARELALRFFSAVHRALHAVFVRFLLQAVLSRLLLLLVYFFVLGPTALILRVFRPRLLRDPPGAATYWVASDSTPPSLERARRQS